MSTRLGILLLHIGVPLRLTEIADDHNKNSNTNARMLIELSRMLVAYSLHRHGFRDYSASNRSKF